MTFVFCSTLYVLNCFEEIFRHICIFYDLSALIWHKWLNLSIGQGVTHWSYPGNVLASDVLVTEGAKESAAMSKTLFSGISQFQQQHVCFLLRYAKCKISSPTLHLTIQFVVVTHANHFPIGILQCMALQTENWTDYASVLQENTLMYFYHCISLSMWYLVPLSNTKWRLVWCAISVNVLNVLGLTL